MKNKNVYILAGIVFALFIAVIAIMSVMKLQLEEQKQQLADVDNKTNTSKSIVLDSMARETESIPISVSNSTGTSNSVVNVPEGMENTIVKYDKNTGETTYINTALLISTTNSTAPYNPDRGDVTNKPYVPDGVAVVTNTNKDTSVADIEFNRTPENVSIEIIDGTLTNESIKILIKDYNEDQYGWGPGFKLQIKNNGEWEYVTPKSDMIFTAIGYVLKDNQREEKIDFGNYYGQLESGTYRIEKSTYDKGYIYFYSNEFVVE